MDDYLDFLRIFHDDYDKVTDSNEKKLESKLPVEDGTGPASRTRQRVQPLRNKQTPASNHSIISSKEDSQGPRTRARAGKKQPQKNEMPARRGRKPNHKLSVKIEKSNNVGLQRMQALSTSSSSSSSATLSSLKKKGAPAVAATDDMQTDEDNDNDDDNDDDYDDKEENKPKKKSSSSSSSSKKVQKRKSKKGGVEEPSGKLNETNLSNVQLRIKFNLLVPYVRHIDTSTSGTNARIVSIYCDPNIETASVLAEKQQMISALNTYANITLANLAKMVLTRINRLTTARDDKIKADNQAKPNWRIAMLPDDFEPVTYKGIPLGDAFLKVICVFKIHETPYLCIQFRNPQCQYVTIILGQDAIRLKLAPITHPIWQTKPVLNYNDFNWQETERQLTALSY